MKINYCLMKQYNHTKTMAGNVLASKKVTLQKSKVTVHHLLNSNLRVVLRRNQAAVVGTVTVIIIVIIVCVV